jgi:centromere protein I
MLPSQLVAVLADPLLQKFLLLRPDEEAYTRIHNWITAVLQDIRTGDADSSTISEVLGVLREYVTVTKVREMATS